MPQPPYVYAVSIAAVIDAALDAAKGNRAAVVVRRALPEGSPRFGSIMARVRRRPCGTWTAEAFAIDFGGERWLVCGSVAATPRSAAVAAIAEGSSMKASRPLALGVFDDAPDDDEQLDELARSL